MTQYQTWHELRTKTRIITAEPIEGVDLFIITLVDGKCTDIRPEHEHQIALQAAVALKKEQDVAIKVLPVTFKELVQLHGIDYAAYVASMKERPANTLHDIDFYKALAARMEQIVSNERADPRVRTEAFKLLKAVGAIHA